MYHLSAHSVFAAVLTALVATLATMSTVLLVWAVLPARVRRFFNLSTVDLFFLGYAGVAILSWYAFLAGYGARGVFHIMVLVFCGGVGFKLYSFASANRPALPIDLAAIAWNILAFFALALLVALQWTPFITADLLNVASVGNNDIYLWAKGGDVLLNYHLGDLGNIVDDNIPRRIKDCFAAFLDIAYWSHILGERAIESLIPVMVQACALIGFIIFHILHAHCRVSRATSMLIAAAILANPFWAYITENYFISQVLATAWMLAFLSRCCEQHKVHENWGMSSLFVCALYFAAGILTYPAKYIGDVAVIAFFALLLLVWDHRLTLARLKIPAGFLPLFGGRLACILGAIALSILLLPAQYAAALPRIIDMSTAKAGWVMQLVNPLLLTGVLNADRHITYPISALMVVGYVVLLGGAAFLFATALRRKTVSTALGALTVLWVLLVLSYIIVYCVTGVSYQQWKFASYYPLATAFVLPALVTLLIRPDKNPRWKIPAPVILNGFLVLMVLCGMLAVAHRKMIVFPAGYRSLATIDDLPEIGALNLEAGPYGETMVALDFIRHKPVWPTAETYYPHGPARMEIDGQKAVFLTNESADNGLRQPDIKFGAGFNLYVTKPGYVFDKPIRFNAPLQMALEGFSVAEDWGRWTNAKQVRIEVPLEALPASDIELTLWFQPFVPAPVTQRVSLHVNGISFGQRSFKDGAETEWTVHVPRASLRAPKLIITLDLPDAIAPATLNPKLVNGDTRMLGIGMTRLLMKTTVK